jgi:hypothetical protein
VLPQQAGKHPDLAVALGKEGTIYVLNRDKMGHFCATCTTKDTQVVQELPGFAPEPGALVYWNNTIYTSGGQSQIKALSLTNGLLSKTPFAVTKNTTYGHSPVISANGTTDGILWQVYSTYMAAYDAVTLVKVYSNTQAPSGRDALPALSHFANFMVANGKFYVGGTSALAVYGLLK